MIGRTRVGTMAFAVSLLGVFAAFQPACTVSVGDDLDGGDFTGNDASTTTDGGVKSDAAVVVPEEKYACYGCLRDSCAGQWAVCQANADCLAIYQCAIAANCINSKECTDACYFAKPNGTTAYDAYYACNDQAKCSSCGTACQVTTTECPNFVPPVDSGTTTPDSGTTTDSGTVVDAGDPVNECSECNGRECPTETAACKPDSDCAKFQDCVGVCADGACVTKCGTDFPDGAKANGALATCSITKCSGPCGL